MSVRVDPVETAPGDLEATEVAPTEGVVPIEPRPDSDTTADMAQDTSLLLGAWNYESGLEMEVVQGPRDVALLITERAGRFAVGGSDGCNNFGGGANFDGGRITWDAEGFGREDMGCGPGVLAIGEAFLGGLREMDRFRVVGDQLELSGPTGLLEFTRAATVDEDVLLSQQWIVDTVIVAGVEQQPPSDGAFVVFGNGGFRASTGCRELAGTWTRPAGNRIVVTAMRADGTCAPDRTEFDGFVTRVLGDGFVVNELTTVRLRIRSGPDGLILRAAGSDEIVDLHGGIDFPDESRFGFKADGLRWQVHTDLESGAVVTVHSEPSASSPMTAEAGPGEVMIAAGVDIVVLDGIAWRQVHTDANAQGWVQSEFLVLVE